MVLPVFNLPTTGTSPKRATIDALETEMNRVIGELYGMTDEGVIAAAATAEAAKDDALSSASSAAASAASAAIGDAMVPYLDVWDAGVGFSVGNYADWIAGIDASLSVQIASGDVTKTALGLCSNGVDQVYSYKLDTGAKEWALVQTGQHSEELLGMAAAWRFFESICKGTNTHLLNIRRNFNILFLPCANPSGFGGVAHSGRLNFNGVNINRNYSPAYWGIYTPDSSANAKGSAGFSEVETQYIRTAIDGVKPVVMVDCHNVEAAFSGTGDFWAQPPSSWHGARGQRRVIAAASAVSRVYDCDPIQPLTSDYVSSPWFADWAARYMEANHGIRGVTVATLEARNEIYGSGPNFSTFTREAIRRYCGLILGIFHAHMASPYEIETTPSPTVFAWRTSTDTVNSIAAGGSRISESTKTAITWQGYVPNATTITSRSIIKAVAPCAGVFLVRAQGYIKNDGGATRTHGTFALKMNGTEYNLGISAVTAQPADGRSQFDLQWRISVTPDAETVYEFELTAALLDGADPDAILYYPTLQITFDPTVYGVSTPRAM